MKNQSESQGFDYSQLPEDVAIKLKESEAKINQAIANLNREMALMKEQLIKIKGPLKLGEFEDFVRLALRSEFDEETVETIIDILFNKKEK